MYLMQSTSHSAGPSSSYYHSGRSSCLSPAQVRHLPEVDYIAEEGIARGEETMWYLDRIDQRRLPVDNHYRPIGGAGGVDVYILDSGIGYSHQVRTPPSSLCNHQQHIGSILAVYRVL